MCSKEELNNQYICEEILLMAWNNKKIFLLQIWNKLFGISSLPLVAVTKARSLSTVKERVRAYIYTEISL